MSEFLFYLLVALLPVAAYSGFRMGKRSSEKKDQTLTSGLSSRYFVGLNYVLNEQPDKAIDTFVKMLEVDSETIETHIALGNLFRKRGEVDRAIRFHQNLIARPSLPAGVRKLALLELGLDYMRAGLFDRAESIFKELLQEAQHKTESLRQLKLIYQQTKDWEKAIHSSEQLQVFSGEDHSFEVAHYYCELSLVQIDNGQLKQAIQSLKKAVAVDPSCARANILRGQLALKEHQPKLALKYFREMLKQNSGFISEVVSDIEQCFLMLNDKKGFHQFLLSSLENGAGISTVLAYTEMLRKDKGDREAAEFIAKQLQSKPSLKGLLRLIQLHLDHAQPAAKPSLEILYSIVSRLQESKPIYRCSDCGFAGKSLFWQCPSCKHWSSVKPIFGLEGE